MMKNDNKKIVMLQAPEHWNDLTFKQLRYLCRTIAAGLNPLYRRQLIFMIWTGIKSLPAKFVDEAGQTFYLFRRRRQFFYLSVEDYAFFLRKIDFCTGRSELTKQLMPHIWALHRKLYGPSSKIYNLTYNEWVHAESCFNRYLNDNKNVNHLNALCAVLYRPGNGIHPDSIEFSGDRREEFNDYVYLKRAQWFRWVPMWQKVAIFLFYTGSREALNNAHLNLKENTTIGEDHTSDIEKHRTLVNNLTQGDVTKNNQVLKSKVWDVFAMLDSQVAQIKKISKK